MDDADQGIGEVVRRADLIETTPRQLLLLGRLLGLPAPSYATCRWWSGPTAPGWPSDTAAAVAWMAKSLGLAKEGELPSPAELVDRFDPARLPRESIVWEPR